MAGVLLRPRGVVERAPEEAHRQPERNDANAAARLLAAIVESSGDAIVSVSLDGVIQSWNAAAERLFAYPASEAVGRSIEMLLPRDRSGEERRIGERVRAGERIERFETVRVRQGGRLVPVSITVSPIRDEADRVIGLSEIVRDETERRQAQRVLRESEQQFRTLVEQVEEFAIFRIDVEGRAVTWNEGVRRVLGYAESEWIGSDIAPLIFTPEDVLAGVPQREMDTAAKTGKAGNDRWMRRKGGERFFAAGVTTALRDDDSRLAGFTKVMRDQTRRKRIEEALHESEVRYRRLFESAKEGILILDAATATVIDANPYISDLLGYRPEDLHGKELWQIGLFGNRAASMAAVREIQDQGYLRYDDLPLETATGDCIEVEVVASVYWEHRRSVIQCNFRDITERIRLERETREQAAALQEEHRRKDEFLAMLSHELRNPLAPIANAVQLLRQKRGPRDAIEERARNILERQVAQLSHLVDDLLEVTRISTGMVQLQRERVSLQSVVGGAVDCVRALADDHGHELAVDAPPQAVWVEGDAARLEQVLVNLLTNAIKYTHRGGRVSVVVEAEPASGVLRVRDTGVGIAPEFMPRLFDLFTQAQTSLDRSSGGLGIGLSLVQRLVELHGGTVDAHSVLGRGSEFVVRLPRAQKLEQRAESVEAREESPDSLRVLVVDDNADSADSLAMLLRARRHDVLTAYDGLGALEAAEKHHPDVVLLDIGLPGLDGFQVAKRMRRDPTLGRALLVAMTGYGQDVDRRRSAEAGFDHHLVKPAEFAELERILATAGDRGRDTDQYASDRRNRST